MKQIDSRLLASVVVAVAIVVATWVGGSAFLHRNDRPKTISVKGGAERDFMSDLVVWDVAIASHSSTPIEGLRDLERQQKVMQDFLVEKGVNPDEIVFGPVEYQADVDSYYDKAQERYVKVSNGYIVVQLVTVTSKEVDKVELVSRSVGELIERDVVAQAQAPRYYYTQLADLKLEMVGKATEDAYERARQIAKRSNAKLGGLRKSSLGVFQIVGKHSQEEYSWGGSLNTSSKEKTVSITVTSEYLIK